MDLSVALYSFLILHLTGLTLMAGTTLVDFLSYRTFWRLLKDDCERAKSALEVMNGFPRLIGIGAALLVLSGIGMMAVTKGVFGDQLWFRIKIGIVVVLIANGLLIGRRLGLKLRSVIGEKNTVLAPEINSVKTNLRRFHIIQLCLFILIIFLSVFKFN